MPVNDALVMPKNGVVTFGCCSTGTLTVQNAANENYIQWLNDSMRSFKIKASIYGGGSQSFTFGVTINRNCNEAQIGPFVSQTLSDIIVLIPGDE